MTLLKKINLYNPIQTLSFILYETKRVINSVFFHVYGQQGEDLIIDKLLGLKSTGFYVDIGAHDPVRFSNTKRFYDKGWNGINIEPDNDCFQNIKKNRPRDINLNFGISNIKKNLTFFHFFPPTLSTFSRDSANNSVNQGFTLIGTKKIPVKKLSSVLDKYAKNQKIDFFSIDTEGNDLKVLKSNNWSKFSPKVICIENGTLKNTQSIETFLTKYDYSKTFTNKINSIYVKN